MMSKHLSSVLTKTQSINASNRVKSLIVIQVMDHHLVEVQIYAFPLIAIKQTAHIPTLVIHTNHLNLMDPNNRNLTLRVHMGLQLLIIVCFK